MLTALLNSLETRPVPQSRASRRRVDGGESEGDKQVVDWAQTAAPFPPLWTFCRQSCCRLNEPALRVSENLHVCSERPNYCSCWNLPLGCALPEMTKMKCKLHFDSQTIAILTRFASIWPLTPVLLITNFHVFTDDLRRVSALKVAPLLCPWNLLFKMSKFKTDFLRCSEAILAVNSVITARMILY